MAGALMDVASHQNLILCRFILCGAIERAACREWLESSGGGGGGASSKRGGRWAAREERRRRGLYKANAVNEVDAGGVNSLFSRASYRDSGRLRSSHGRDLWQPPHRWRDHRATCNPACAGCGYFGQTSRRRSHGDARRSSALPAPISPLPAPFPPVSDKGEGAREESNIVLPPGREERDRTVGRFLVPIT
jgi:hypothetical protein